MKPMRASLCLLLSLFEGQEIDFFVRETKSRAAS